MPRYFFHLQDGQETRDEEGVQLPDVAAARDVALENARSMVCEDVMNGQLNLDNRIEVTDEQGAILLTLTFREAFEIRGG